MIPTVGTGIDYLPRSSGRTLGEPVYFLISATGAETPHLARKPNYDFEKRRKEMDRQAKKDAKREERQRRKDAGEPEPIDERPDLNAPNLPSE